MILYYSKILNNEYVNLSRLNRNEIYRERKDVKGLRKEGREGKGAESGDGGGSGLSKGIVIGHEELTGQATSGIDQDPVGSRTSDESLHRVAEVRSSVERKMAGSLSPVVVLSHALALAHYVD